MSVRFRKPWVQLYFLVSAVLFTALMVVGIWRHHTDIPFFDMWDGYLGFYIRSEQDWSAWWEQHNEHRLILSRILFWADLRFFHGSMILLYVLNAVFPLLIAGSFIFLIQRLCPRSSVTHTALAAVMVVLATSWMQYENFIWAFQSQFFLAYLLPLLAFILLAHAQATGRRRSFWLAWLAGIVSAGAMANATFVLPLMAVQAWVLRLSKRDIGVLLLTAALVLGLYLHHYQTLPGYQNITPKGWFVTIEHSQIRWFHLDLVKIDAPNWLDRMRYVLLFWGGPWYFKLDKAPLWPTMVAGAVWLVLALTAAWRVLRQHPVQPYAFALLALMAYVGTTALGGALDRVVQGLEQALSSRYLTPQLMAWTALLLLGVYLWPRAATSRWALALYAAIPLLLLPVQLWVFMGPTLALEMRVPALAVLLGVRDFKQIRRMSLENERPLFELAEQARREHLAMFDEPDMQLALQYWSGGQQVGQTPRARCDGNVDAVKTIDGVSGVVRVRGWLYDPQGHQSPSLVSLSGAEHGRGVALGGLPQPDAEQALHQRHASTAGFGGYLQTAALAQGRAVVLTGWVDQRPVCTVALNLPKQS